MSRLSTRTIFFYSPLFVILYNLAGNLSNDIYLPILPVLAKDLQTSDFLVQFSITVWFLGVATPQIYFGLIADKFGTRPLMLWGGLIFLIGTLFCFLSTHIYLLLLGRFLQGIGVSSLNIVTFTTIRSSYYNEQVSVKFISWVNIMGSIAPLVGPPLGSFLCYFFGWRSTFSFILALGCLTLIGLYHFLIEGNETVRKVDFKIGFGSSWAYYVPLFKNKYLWYLIGAYTACLGALIAYLTSAPFIVTDQFKIPLKYFGLTQIPPAMAYLIGAMTVNLLLKKYPLQHAVYLGFVIISFSAFYFLFLSFYASFFTYLFGAILFMYGFALLGSPLMSMILSTGSDNKGAISALLGLTMASMAGLASLLIALFFNGKDNSWVLIIFIFILSSITFYFASRKRVNYDR
ncbi:MFS transporter [Legionella maceachernii]|uniref:Transporter of the major facilitator superfamily (MFS) n=1 Tax=Legionella maceachernii TaxID=466 RepID=A0A0W0WEZ7_9GAMM|nr:MFS transporter [Legionella maceachernii]KTD30582.1 transporter of the major facilitator superfamily (MFS) [Legionella maceachernii]SJZ97520.1 Major Facilitator Superfamily protein [Legionella maceachernii]SUP01078.1 Inner membrane transport protein ydhC [Legionella maceachernii]